MLGRCARTGQIGAVVTTSSIAVGSRCAHVRPGIGAVLTQHRTDPRLGPLGLDFLAQGFSPEQALAGVVAATPDHAWRQLAAIDAQGDTAAFTGANVRAAHNASRGRDCVAIGNILRHDQVPDAMTRAFAADPAAPLAERLVAAILAGEAAGGETAAIRSAHLLVMHRQSFPYVDLRVDDHPQPLTELARLWALYAPDVDDYVLRAIAPDRAASYIAPPPKG
jgi:uncharacterized Ntn-hydrolase superfamily protein